MGSKQAMIDFVVDWCNDDSHGYSQAHRNGPDCDCSSLMYMAARHAGYDVGSSNGWTGSMRTDFTRAGFTSVSFDGNLYDCEPGCIALNEQHHTEMFVDWGVLGGAHIDEHGGVQGCCQGDQRGNEVSVGPAYIPSYGWDYILIPPDDGGSTPVKPPTGDIDAVAQRVINGEYGNGDERRRRLESEGYSYTDVQSRVNAILRGDSSPAPAGKSVDDLAREVINGNWGNGDERRQKLTAAGYDYDAVQRRVNEIL